MGCAISTDRGPRSNSEGPRDALARRHNESPSSQVRKTVFDLEAENSALRKASKILQPNLVRDEFRRSVYEVYEIVPDLWLGEGRFGKVTVAQHRKTGSKYALKIIAAGAARSSGALAEFLQEIAIHKSLGRFL